MQLDTLTLPTDLIWIDEFEWTPIQQTQTYSITGALIIERGTKLAGQSITLAGDNTSGLISRADLNLLKAKLNTTSTMVLTLNDARTFNVIFNHSKNPIEAKPQIDYSDTNDADLYTLKINLLAV
jgi:hypothetical protein